MQMATPSIWPTTDYSRVPYQLYHSQTIYDLEQERVFAGPTWSMIGLAAEIPHPGDFRASYIGEVPIIYNRDRNGDIKAFVNRCAHRGALVRREICGNAGTHICIYHQWCFRLDGSLLGVPLRHGINGKGGYGKDFQTSAHGLQPVRIGNVCGVLFGTLSQDAAPVEAYLGDAMLGYIRRVFCSPIRILGYHRQRIRGNWKAFAENTRDNYHASLLHDFFRSFGLDRLSQEGGATMDARHRHCVTWGRAGSDTNEAAREVYASAKVASAGLTLADPSLVTMLPDRIDELSVAITSLFPNAVIAQISNSIATRQIRPKGPNAFEIFQTVIGYEDDTPDMVRHRLRQANLVGPAGFVSMEDGEAIEIAHRATKAASAESEVLELGGGGEIADCDYRVNDVPVRGFWSYYAELLGIEPPGAVR